MILGFDLLEILLKLSYEMLSYESQRNVSRKTWGPKTFWMVCQNVVDMC